MKTRAGVYMLIFVAIVLGGCDSLRFAPSENAKQNAWMHNKTVTQAAGLARDEATSEELQKLTTLSELQSEAILSYYGMPKNLAAMNVDDLTKEENFEIAEIAAIEGVQRPDVFDVTESAFDIGFAIVGLLGGVYGTRAARFLSDARTKTQALKEIVRGNEVFKNQNSQYAEAFKQAQSEQSPGTKQLVTQMKG